MIHFKNSSENHTGFTLIEVLIALAIMMIVMIPVFMAQNRMTNTIAQYTWLLQRTLIADDFLYKSKRAIAPDTQQTAAENMISNPPTKMLFSINKVPGDSILKNFNDIYIEKVNFEWSESGRLRHTALGGYVYKPKRKSS
ncbi:MAG TPA: prepilin-type N-terminal cleavage/methylation domain-containing protein [Candidatus Babeliales bacterium]|nr:prepilin-type N-terminal cleavage/methylation domain-containing protein [Candidatus Babeliales bacterium]